MIYIVDIETKPNNELRDVFCEGIKAPSTYKDPVKIANYIKWKKAEAHKGMSISTDFSKILCIGIKELGQPAQVVSLSQFGIMMRNDDSPHLVTFNGKHFDIPIIIKQGIMNGVDLPYKWLFECAKRFSSHDHTDMMEVLSFGGTMMSLDKYLQVYCGVQKKPIDFTSASDEEIVAHCLEDIAYTELLYNKFSSVV